MSREANCIICSVYCSQRKMTTWGEVLMWDMSVSGMLRCSEKRKALAFADCNQNKVRNISG